jgi:uncharacterized protein YjiS (DUF1127 family)
MTDQTSSETVFVAPDGTASDRLERASRNLPRRKFFDDMPDKGLFALVAVLGFAAILFFKLKNFNANYVAAGAVALMLAYGLVAYQFPKVRMRLDRLGDNFYYLGFLFTLASLSAALIQLQQSISIDDVLGSFGIALFTTIVGVAGRVLFVQMRGDIEEVEDEVRRDLLSAANDLRSQLSLALSEFETFQTGVRQAAQTATANIPDTASAALESIATTAQKAADRIERTFSTQEDTVNSINQSISKAARALEDIGLNQQDQMREFNQRLDHLLEKLGATVGWIERRGSKRRWYWPFKKRVD